MLRLTAGNYFDSAKDLVRDAELDALGFRLLRFWNNQIFENLEGVLTVILQHLQTATPLPNPSSTGGEGL
ncbi:MAG: DUF559 domain-containing protein [Methylotenera sp.]